MHHTVEMSPVCSCILWISSSTFENFPQQKAPVTDVCDFQDFFIFQCICCMCLPVDETGPKTSVCCCYTATFIPSCSHVSELCSH